MCAIYGVIGGTVEEGWRQDQAAKAARRGKDETVLELPGRQACLWHWRLATNPATEPYPISVGGITGAMNGIVSQGAYQGYRQKYGDDIGDDRVDTAYMLHHLDEQPETAWQDFDDLDHVFALWAVKADEFYIAAKDNPLFYKLRQDGALVFSTFKFEPDVQPLKGVLQVSSGAYGLRALPVYDFSNFVYYRPG